MSYSNFEENVLYVKSLSNEWKLEREPTVRSFKERCESLVELQSKGSAWSYLSNLTLNKNYLDCHTPEISKLIDSQSAWKIVLSNSREKLAVLQDLHIEIRFSENDFGIVYDKWALPSRDLFPLWRNLAWSPCDSHIAFSDSSGNVFLYSSTGEQLSHVVQSKDPTCDLGNAACALIFKGRRSFDRIDEHQHWVHELLVLTYEGILTTFVVSLEGDHRILHTFDFNGGYPNGILDAVFVPSYSLLFVGGGPYMMHGFPLTEMDGGEMMKHGISAWRVLSGFPYYKNISDTDVESFAMRTKIFPSKKGWWPWSSSEAGDRVFKMTLSPDCKTLVSVHSSENICIWNLPSLRLFRKFSLKEQPDRDCIAPKILKKPKIKRTIEEFSNDCNIVSMGWWSNQDLIIFRRTGSLIVSNIENLKNRLGSSPEFFESEAMLMRFSDGCFYVLECKKIEDCPKRDDMLSESEDGNENSIDVDEYFGQTWMSINVWNHLKQGLHYITSFDAFQLPKKKIRIARRTYRMTCLKSTTPEELYSNMLDTEEYGEALLLAKKYNLDCDLSYQRQWKKFPVSVSTIQDYLWKITKRSWVLHECLETVPDGMNAMEELIKYGLRGTDLEAVIIAGRDDDDAKFFFCESMDDYKSMDCETVESRITEEERRQELLKQIDFDNLTFSQKELCRIRLKLLHYLDKFETYQEILGGKHIAHERYDWKFFKRFRKDNIVYSAMKFAQHSDIAALESLFRHHGDEILPHRLPILCNIPETTMPHLFYNLLPRIRFEVGESFVEEMEEYKLRKKLDWSEMFCRFLNGTPPEEPADLIYRENSDLLEFRKGKILTEEQLSMWFKRRSLEVEKKSGQVDCALELLRLGIKNNVQGLDFLHDDFALMEVLVYECQVDASFSYESLQKMTRVERMYLMMAKTSQEMYIRNIKRWVVPYLKQQEAKTRGSYYLLLMQYLVEMSSEDLTFVELIFLENKQKSGIVIEDISKMFSIASGCLYAHNRCDQLYKIKTIIQCLPDLSDRSEDADMKSIMFSHLLGTETLKRNGIEHTLAQVRDIQSSEIGTRQVLERLVRISAKRNPPMNPRELELLLSDMCLLQEKVFTLITRSKTYEIFIGALLTSGNLSHINLGGAIMESQLKLFSANADSLNKLIPQKQSIRSSIKDSIKSFTGSSSHILNCAITGEIMNCSVDPSKFTELVLQAAVEYFNSSPDCLHENMKLARACLELMKDRASEVQVELNLIEALAMLKFHGISEFPAQLRMSEDRLEYIKCILKRKNMMYKNYSKLLELGKLLNIGQGDEKLLQGKILDLIALHAFEANDMIVCLDSCKKIMSLNYGNGWKMCKSLAENENFHDDISKSELFNFVMLHVPDYYLSGVLDSFENYLIRVANKMASHNQSVQSAHQFIKIGSIGSLENIVSDRTRHVLSLSKTALDCIGDTQWWLGAAMELKKFSTKEARKNFRSEQTDDGNNFTKQTSHPFYKILKGPTPLSRNEVLVDMDIYISKEACHTMLDVNGLILQIQLFRGFDGINYDKFSEDIARALLVIAENVFYRETSLGLFCLLALPKACSAEKCFNHLPKTILCYQVAAYFFALRIASQMKTLWKCPSIFLTCHPKLLLHHIEVHDNQIILPKEEKKSFDYYIDLLINYQESETLANIDRGIDVVRFSSDESYKKETILGMALSLDDKLLSYAMKLARKYKLLPQDLYMAHLGYLFDVSCGLTTEEIEGRIQGLNVLDVLNECPMRFNQMMHEQIFPLIDGRDLDRLILFYKCLIPVSTCESEIYDYQKIMPEAHIEMLEKFKTATKGLNYKDLILGKCDVESVIKPILDENNVEIFSNFTKYIFEKRGNVGNPSIVYKCYASKILHTPIIGSEDDWMLRHKICHEFIQKLIPEALIEFVHENLFGMNAIKKMVPIEIRKQILKTVIRHARHELSLSRGKNSQDASKWEEVGVILQKDLDHLNKMSSKAVSRLTLSNDENKRQYAIDFDLTQSESMQVKKLFRKMILDGESIEFVDDMIKSFSLKEFTCENVYIEVVEELCSSLKEPEAEYYLTKLKIVFHEILRHSSVGGSLIKTTAVCLRLKNAVTNPNVSPCIKVQIVDLIKSFQEEDIKDIICSQTCAILSLLGYDNQLAVERLSEEHQRNLIFNELLEHMTTDQVPNILCLLNIWVDHLPKNSENLWQRLLTKLIVGFPDNEDIIYQVLQLAREFVTKSYLNIKELEQLADLMVIKDALSACKVLFVFPSEDLTRKAILILQTLEQDIEDQELFILLLKHCKLPMCTSLPFYHKLMAFMITSGSRNSEMEYEEIEHLIPLILKDLLSAEQKFEAGTLYMSLKSTKKSMRTFDASINFSNKFISM